MRKDLTRNGDSTKGVAGARLYRVVLVLGSPMKGLWAQMISATRWCVDRNRLSVDVVDKVKQMFGFGAD